MKSTTQSQLAEHAYRDYLRETAPSDNKRAISFVFNTYASRFGLPLVMTATLPQRIAKIYRAAISCLNNMPLAGENPKQKRPLVVSTRWLQEQITDAWGL